MDRKRRHLLFKLLDGMAVVCFILSFSPLVIPKFKITPLFMGVPYTMWVSFLMSLLFLVLAYMVSLVNKKMTDAD